MALAEAAGQAASVVKKDIEMTGAAGKTGVGYQITTLINDIENFLGWNNRNEAFLVGVGNLGSALLGHEGFKQYGLSFVAAFDVDPDKVGKRIRGIEVLPLTKFSSLAQRMHITAVVLTVPAAVAQGAVDMMVESGIASIWSFVPAVLSAPASVVIQREDLSAGLAEFMVRQRANRDVMI